MTALLIRLLQAALNSLLLPPGIQPALVMLDMPLTGWRAMPFINVTTEVIRQSDTAIGEDVINPTNANVWTLFANAERIMRVTIITPTAEERDFYRDTLLVIFRILCGSVFSALGLNARHGFQAASYPVARERDGQIPGFYAAELFLKMDGVFVTSVQTDYPIILGLSASPTYSAAANISGAL